MTHSTARPSHRARRPRRSSWLAAGLAAGIVVVPAAGAWGWWSGLGSGGGDGATASGVVVTLTTATPSSALLPGGTASLATTATNSSAAAVRLRSLALDTSRGTSGFAVDAGHAACSTTSLSFTTQDNGGAGWTVPASGTLSLDLPGAVAMAADAANACQGATFTVYLKAGP